jgi:hypothetical protein
MTSAERRPRLVSLDLLRLVILVPVLIMHVWNVFFGETDITLSETESFYQAYRVWLAPTLGYAGIYVFSLSFFLYGFFNSTRPQWGVKSASRVVLLTLAVLSTQFNSMVSFGEPGYFIWDLFSFILLSFLLVGGLSFLGDRGWAWAGISGALLMCVHPLLFQDWLELSLLPVMAQIFVPTSSDFGLNGWFLLPWIGLPLVAVAFGRWCRAADETTAKLTGLALVAASLIVWLIGQGVHVRPLMTASQYYDFSFRQHPLYFWRYYLLFALALLILSRSGLNQRLMQTPLRLAGSLKWSQHFWLAYIFQFGVIDVLSDLKEPILAHPPLFDLLWIIVFVMVELLLQAFFRVLPRYARAWAWLRGKFRVEKQSVEALKQ